MRKKIDALQHDPSDRIPAGGFLTTSHDLIYFAIETFIGGLVKPATFKKLHI